MAKTEILTLIAFLSLPYALGIGIIVGVYING